MTTAGFSSKLITSQMEPLTLHSGKSTSDPGPHRSSVLLISHLLQVPCFNPTTMDSSGWAQTYISRWPHSTSSLLCLFACLPLAFFYVTIHSVSSPALRMGWVTTPGVILNQWSMGLSESHPPGRVLEDIHVLLKRSWQNWAHCGPKESSRKHPNTVVFLSLSCSPCLLTSGIISPVNCPKSEAPKSLFQFYFGKKQI